MSPAVDSGGHVPRQEFSFLPEDRAQGSRLGSLQPSPGPVCWEHWAGAEQSHGLLQVASVCKLVFRDRWRGMFRKLAGPVLDSEGRLKAVGQTTLGNLAFVSRCPFTIVSVGEALPLPGMKTLATS